MVKKYVLTLLIATSFSASYGMEKESSKTSYLDKLKSLVVGLTGYRTHYSAHKELAKAEYIEDARQLSGEKNLYFSLLPKDVLGIVQHYRLNEMLDRALRAKAYSESFASIQKLVQLPEYAQLFNDPRFMDSLIQKISNRFGKDPEEVARDINTLGAQLWLIHIRPDQIKLFEAAQRGDLAEVQQLRAQGVSVNAHNRAGETAETALIGATICGHIEVVKMIIAWGADINAQSTYGYTALIRAATWGHTEIVKELIKARADVNAQGQDGWTALLKTNNVEVVKELIKAGADVNAQENHGWTALMSAAVKGRIEVVKILIGSGANVNARSASGWTALMDAAKWGHAKVVKILIATKADVNAQDQYGWTALMDAASHGHIEVVKELIAAGADVNIQDEDGDTALNKARTWNRTEIIKLLESVKNT